MPGYKGHIAGGLVFAGAGMAATMACDLYRPAFSEAVILVGVALMGALFPDVDTDSKGQNLFYALLVVVDLALMVAGEYRWAAVLGFAAMLPALGHHRGWTHTWWAMLAVPLAVCLLPIFFYGSAPAALAPYYAAAVTGYLSHLVLDGTF